LTPADRADIVLSVNVLFVYTIEFQKRGLPHCHTLLWVDSKNKITDASQIDEYIFVELPDPVKDPRGYKVVSELMLHVPYGAANLNSKKWNRRQITTKKSMGRLTYVHPSSGELFYFRMLLCHQKGCKSPTEVKTINGEMFPTYRAACEAMGLLGDDKECDIALQESAFSATSFEIRTLFAQILIYCDVADPVKLWNKHWESMQDDIPMKIS
ncbi:hypothetical protein Tco_1481271, partial [Tanacetum coccineum]